jgi:hypothetical protein
MKNKGMRKNKKEVREMVCSECDSLTNMAADQPAPLSVGRVNDVSVQGMPKA